MDAWNDRIWLAAGALMVPGCRSTGRRASVAGRGTWWRTIAPPEGEAGGAGVQDIMDVSIHPLTPELATFGSLEEGLIDIRETEVEAYWNPSNSLLEWNANWQDPRCAVPALDYDRLGNLWLINEGTETPCTCGMRKADGTCLSWRASMRRPGSGRCSRRRPIRCGWCSAPVKVWRSSRQAARPRIPRMMISASWVRAMGACPVDSSMPWRRTSMGRSGWARCRDRPCLPAIRAVRARPH